MVKFVGGPSVSAQKSYYNHRIARPGQFRIPRAYGSVKKETKIVVRNYNYCGNSYGNYGGWQLPSWLQWFQLGANWLQNLIPQPKVQEQPTPEQPTPDPVVKKKDDPDPVEDDTDKKTEVETPSDPKNNIFASEAEIIEEVKTETKEIKEEPKSTTVNIGLEVKTLSDGTKEYSARLWDAVANGYGFPNTKANRDEFRKTYLGGADYIPKGDQQLPNKVIIGGQEYTLNADKFNATPKTTWRRQEKTTEGQAKGGEGTTRTETVTTRKYTCSASYTINGERKPITVTGEFKTEKEARDALIDKVKHSGLTGEQLAEALRKAQNASVRTVKQD